MIRLASAHEIDYPESDGRPMGETDLHRWWMIHIDELLRRRYRGQHVYVGSDLLLYYVEGDPKKFVVPDHFVVLDCKSEQRRTFKLWIEQRVPNVVIEVTSRKTKKQDHLVKPSIYAQMGVRELFLYDPSLEYLSPALQGYRLVDGSYVPINGNGSGAQECRELGLLLRLDRERLVIQDAATGLPLLTEAEAEQARAEAESQRAEAEHRRAEVQSQRAEAQSQRAEAEHRRAEAERQRAEAERQRAEAERQRADAAEELAKMMERELERVREQLRARGE